MNKPNIYKRQVGLRVDLQVCRKVERKFGRKDDDNNSVAFIRAFEDATRDVVLTADDYQMIADEAKRNASKRNKKGSK